VSLRDPRGSGIGSETIFALVYTSTDSCSIVAAILNFRRSIQKLEKSQASFLPSVNPSIHPSTLQTFIPPTTTNHTSPTMSAQTTIPKIQLTAEEIAFKAEHDAITSYEEGWDNWDGPQWPIGTVQCSIRTITPISSISPQDTNSIAEANWEDRSVPPTPAVEADEPQFKN
jgi:hypothetical protein